MDDPQVDPLATSRLDIVSCGLGAAALLAIVLSIPRDLASPDPAVTRFLRFHIYCSDPNSELRLFVKPDTSPPFDISLRRRADGSFEPAPKTSAAAEIRIRDTEFEPPKPEDVIVGSLPSSVSVSKMTPVATVAMLQPVGQEWEVKLLYSGRLNRGWDGPRRSRDEPTPNVQAVMLVDNPQSRKASFELLPNKANDPKSAEISFGRFAYYPQKVDLGSD